MKFWMKKNYIEPNFAKEIVSICSFASETWNVQNAQKNIEKYRFLSTNLYNIELVS